MVSQFASAALCIVLFAFSTFGELPPNEKLSGKDERQFSKELARLEALVSTANNKCAIKLQIANTYAAGGQFSEAMQRLRAVAAANVGVDPSRDVDFRRLRATAEFQSVMQEAYRQTPPVQNSGLVATLDSRDVRPGSIAYDTKRNALLLGNIAGFEVIRCSLHGDCRAFVTVNDREESYVLGLKVDQAADAVWVTKNMNGGASLRCYDLSSGKLRRAASINGNHVFNDLTISSADVVYVTDTAEGSVYRLTSGTNVLQRIASHHALTATNGIAISPDEKLLYVAAWEDGVDVINLPSGTVAPVVHPDNICLAFIDALYATQRSLIAIQNGPMLPRIVKFALGENRVQVASMKVPERRNPAFDGITTGVLVRNNFYFIASPQTDKQSAAELRALQLFRISIDY